MNIIIARYCFDMKLNRERGGGEFCFSDLDQRYLCYFDFTGIERKIEYKKALYTFVKLYDDNNIPSVEFGTNEYYYCETLFC